jgi:hypothetical protein
MDVWVNWRMMELDLLWVHLILMMGFVESDLGSVVEQKREATGSDCVSLDRMDEATWHYYFRCRSQHIHLQRPWMKWSNRILGMFCVL